MKPTKPKGFKMTQPELIEHSVELGKYLKSLNSETLAKIMKVSPDLAKEIKKLLDNWTETGSGAVMLTFRGDVYSGLQANTFDREDIEYANSHLRVLSGLYGILRPLDAINPYRLEMGYKLPDIKYSNLYKFWGNRIADLIDKNEKVINLTSGEYGKVITPKLNKEQIISPIFYTYNPKTRKNTTVAVHSKIARGAFAHWLIKHKANDKTDLTKFNELNYIYEPSLSTPNYPVFVCQEFGGKGLSMRLI